MLIFWGRKVQQIRGSFFIPLPPQWIKSNEIKKSDRIRIELLEDGSLKICPVPQSSKDSNEFSKK